jgi:hypothetical protein
VLWRVILVVLSIFGGVGVLVYLLGWLLLPADGDTASPVEALIWRGHSSTSSTVTIIAGIVVLASIGVGFTNRFSPGFAGLGIIAVAAVLLLRDRRGVRSYPPNPNPASAPPPPPPTYSTPTYSTPTYSQPPYSPPTYPTDPPTGGSMSSPTAFAPYGPFGPTAPPPAPPTPPPPAPRRPRSPLGRLVFSIALLAVGGLVLAQVSGASIPAAVYPATALGIVGLGLVIGAWFGRGRGLIALGIILTILIGGVGAASFGHNVRGGTVVWRPASLSQVESSYDAAFGDATLDLSKVDFASAGGPVNVRVAVHAGSLDIILPSDVDTTVTSTVTFGDAEVFKDSQSGIQAEANTVTDLGPDGRGGGQLNLTTQVNFGSLEVHR